MHKYTSEQINYLREHHTEYSLAELTKKFNQQFGLDQTDSALRNALAKRGLNSGRKPGYSPENKPKPYTANQIDFLKEGYRKLTAPELTRAFNARFNQSRTENGVRGALDRHGIKCCRERGMSPREVKPLGHERICKQTGCIMIKIDEPDPYMSSKTRHRHKHIVIWERANGPLPDGHCLRFLDGDKTHCMLENLGLFTRAENMHLNHLGFNDAPEELRETILLIARLRGKATERKRELLEADND